MTRPEILAELANLRNDDGLDHVADAEGRTVDDPQVLSDEHLRKLLKLARWRQLLWSQQESEHGAGRQWA